MLNGLAINTGVINSEQKVTSEPIIGTIISTSFSLNLQSKYAFKISTGSYFNFNSICISGKKYGNYIVSHTFDDVPLSELFKYSNSLRNGGVIFDKRYQEMPLEMNIIITSDSITNLEKEIRDLKAALEIGGECYRNEQAYKLKTTAILTDFEVGRLRLTGTSVKIKMLSVDPFWQTENATTVFNENNTGGSFSGSLSLSNTKIRGFVKHILYIETVTGTISTMTLSIGGFPITINETLTSGTSIVLDGINNEVLVNGTKVRYLGQFTELEINTPHALTVTFGGGGSVDDFDLYNIYLNQQL